MGNGNDDEDDSVPCVVDSDCYNQMHLCDTFVCTALKCVYTPIDCSDPDECTINERCDPLLGECVADMNPACAGCDDCCIQNPFFQEQILITNRGDRTTSILYANSETVRTTLYHDVNAEPIAINVPGCCGYDVGVGESEWFAVGDRLNSKVRFIDARTLQEFASVNTCSGLFHMYYHQIPNQMWVTCEISKTLTVIDLTSFTVINQNVAVPANLTASYYPHDVTVGSNFAIVTMIGQPASSWLIKYATSNRTVIASRQVCGNAHIFYTGESSEMVYVACEVGYVLMLNPTTFTVVKNVTVAGAHGLWQQGNVLYVTSTTDADGIGSLFAFNVAANTFDPLLGSPYTLPVRNPHNLMPTRARTKLFITHTRDSKITVCDLGVNGTVTTPCRIVSMHGSFYDTQGSTSTLSAYDGTVIEPGFAGPMAIGRMIPFCDCQTSCYDGDPCTTDICHMIGLNSPTHQCVNDVIPDCGTLDHCVHEVNITVHDHSVLTVEEDNGCVRICHTSSYQGNNSAVVIGFDPYDNCDLNERGTCDNREAIADTIPSYCAAEALGNGLGCSLLSGDHSLTMPGLATDLLWNHTISQATFVFDALAGTGHLHGVVRNPLAPTMILHVNIQLTGLVPAGTIPLGAPLTSLPLLCYVTGGGSLDPLDWRYFTAASGSIVGLPGTAYEGLYISVTSLVFPFQMGVGANAKNNHFGLAGGFNWVVLHQPLNQYITVSNPILPGNVNIDLNDNCTTPIDYCELFGEPQAPPANGWVVSLNQTAGEITYCRNFTLTELVGCRAFDRPLDHLFNYTIDPYTYDILYSGAVYATTLLPWNCDSHHDIGVCGEDVVFQTQYHVVIELLASGTLSVNFERTDIAFDAHWLRNIWLSDGDLRVCFETRVRHIEPTNVIPHTTALMFNHIDPLTETGYPLHIVDDMVPCNNEDGFCYQTWCLESEDALLNEIEDFSGFKRLVFAVKVNGETKVYVTINLYIEAYHYGGNTHVQTHIDADLQLYSDPYFSDPYEIEDGEVFIDCSTACGDIAFLGDCAHLIMVIKQAYICYSNDMELLPYDPQNPGSTGCNTPGSYVHQDLVYSEDDTDPIVEYHEFYLVEGGEYGHQRFCFVTHAVTPHGQLLQISYYAIDPSIQYKQGDVNAPLLELQTRSMSASSGSKQPLKKETRTYGGYGGNEDDSDEWHDHYTPEEDCDYEHSLYAVHCERGKHYDYELHRCVWDEHHEPPPPHYDDDDEDYGPRPPHHYYDDEDDDSDDNNTMAYIIIAVVVLGALAVMAYIFGWFGSFRNVPVAGITAVSSTKQQQQVVHQHFVDDRDTVINGNNNNVQHYTSTSPSASFDGQQGGIQQRRNFTNQQQQQYQQNNRIDQDTFTFF